MSDVLTVSWSAVLWEILGRKGIAQTVQFKRYIDLFLRSLCRASEGSAISDAKMRGPVNDSTMLHIFSYTLRSCAFSTRNRFLKKLR